MSINSQYVTNPHVLNSNTSEILDPYSYERINTDTMWASRILSDPFFTQNIKLFTKFEFKPGPWKANYGFNHKIWTKNFNIGQMHPSTVHCTAVERRPMLVSTASCSRWSRGTCSRFSSLCNAMILSSSVGSPTTYRLVGWSKVVDIQKLF